MCFKWLGFRGISKRALIYRFVYVTFARCALIDDMISVRMRQFCVVFLFLSRLFPTSFDWNWKNPTISSSHSLEASCKLDKELIRI